MAGVKGVVQRPWGSGIETAIHGANYGQARDRLSDPYGEDVLRQGVRMSSGTRGSESSTEYSHRSSF